MTNVLVLHSSPRRAELSVSRRLTAEVLIRLARSEPGIAFVERDLAAEAPPHVGAALLDGARKPEGERTPEEQNAVACSNGMIDQLFWADVLVVGAPMYNFGIPTVLKTWIDNISVAGRTFRYDSGGKAHGMVRGKRALVVTSRGGDYRGAGDAPGNYADPQVRTALALLGILDLHVIAADWQSLYPEARRDGLEIARRRIVELVAA